MLRSACQVSESPEAPSADPMTAVVEVTPPEGAQPELAAPKARPVVSKAAIRRLAHDVGARLGKDAHVAAVVELEAYVHRVLDLAVYAMTFARRKSVDVSHVLFAAEAHGDVPSELGSATADDLKRLLRCNPLAPASLRKETLRHGEISEASFAKVTKGVAKKCKDKLRITGGARHLLQLLTEYHLMKSFDRRGRLTASSEKQSATQHLLAEVYGCGAAEAARLVAVFERLCDRMPSLLAMADVKTVDERLVRAALLPDQPVLARWAPRAAAPAAAVKIVGRLLRGRAADKRITTGAAAYLAAALQEFQRLQEGGADVEQEHGGTGAP